MKKTCLFFMFNIISLLFLAAQENTKPATVQWGDAYKEIPGSFVSKIAGVTPEGVYVLREKQDNLLAGTPSKAYVEFYNKLMHLAKSKEIDLRYKGKKRLLEDMIFVKDRLFMLTSYNNEAQGKNYLFVQNIRTEKLIPETKLTKIAEIESAGKYVKGFYGMNISRDSSKILVYGNPATGRAGSESFVFHVFDDQFQELWKQDLKLPYRNQNFQMQEYQVDNRGNVYLLGILYDDAQQNTRRRGKPAYQYIVLACTKDSDKFTEYKVSLEDKFITDLTFRIADDGKLVCCGFYSEKGTFSIKGTYFFRINPETKEMYNKNLKPFDFDFVTEYFSKGQIERAKNAEQVGNTKKQAELYEYDLNNMYLRSDGGVLLVAEQYFIEEQTTYYYDGTQNRNLFYNYNDIIVVNIQPDGEIEWVSRIPKRQETLNDGGFYSSYAMAVVQDKLFFIYNDNPKNFDPGNNRLFEFNGRNSIVALTEIRKDGSATSYPLFSNRDAGTITRPKLCKQSGRREMTIFGEKDRAYQFGSLMFE